MNLREELSKMPKKEKVCVKVQNGIVCTDKVKRVIELMDYYMDYEVKEKTVSYESKFLHRSLVKLTTIYI